jgi:uncharacterized protein YcnI
MKGKRKIQLSYKNKGSSLEDGEKKESWKVNNVFCEILSLQVINGKKSTVGAKLW